MRTQLHRRPADLPLFPGDESEEESTNPDEDREPRKDEGSGPDELWPPDDEPEEVIDDDPEPR